MYTINNKYLVHLRDEIPDNIDENIKKNEYDRWIEITRVKNEIITMRIPNFHPKIKLLYKKMKKFQKNGKKIAGILKLQDFDIQILYYFTNIKHDINGIWIKYKLNEETNTNTNNNNNNTTTSRRINNRTSARNFSESTNENIYVINESSEENQNSDFIFAIV